MTDRNWYVLGAMFWTLAILAIVVAVLVWTT